MRARLRAGLRAWPRQGRVDLRRWRRAFDVWEGSALVSIATAAQHMLSRSFARELVAWLLRGMPVFSKPEEFGLPLAAIYGLWIAAVAALYPLCRKFGEVKQCRKDWWLSYL